MAGQGQLFSSLDIGKLRLRNRIVMPAHGARLGNDRYLRYLEERLQGGIGLLICARPSWEAVDSYSAGPPSVFRGYAGEPDEHRPDPVRGARYYDEVVIPAASKEAELAHKYGVPCFAQLGHTGSYAISPNMQVPLSASGLPDEMLGENSHALTAREIRDVATTFVLAADRAKQAGMDGVEVHAAHGLLLNSFLSPLTNTRRDEYGGSFENRVRILREVLEGIRERVGPGFPVGVRLSVPEPGAHVRYAEEGTAVGVAIADLIDYFSVSSASESGRKSGLTVPVVMPGAEYPQAAFRAGAAALRRAVSVPVLITGRITDPEAAEQLIRDGVADLVGLVRALIADPHWPNKVKEGDQPRTRGGGMSIACTVNAAAGREAEMEIRPASPGKRVMVVGAGPGGMEAARVAALRGHQVSLWERSAAVGGQVLVAARDPRAGDLGNTVDYLGEQIRRLRVELHLGAEVDEGTIGQVSPDAVILATGARPRVSPSPSPDDTGPRLVSVFDVLTGVVAAGQSVLVVAGFDGHRGPLLLARSLAESGRRVELITERVIVGESQDPATNHVMTKALLDAGVTLTPLTGLAAVDGGGVSLVHALTRAASQRDGVDTVISFARAADDALAVRLSAAGDRGPAVYSVGDCLAPRRIMHAVLEGARAAQAL